jgi:hypothetical protein
VREVMVKLGIKKMADLFFVYQAIQLIFQLWLAEHHTDPSLLFLALV